MKYYKILVVAIVSAVVAILTTLMGVTGTIIGSVISSVAYNVLVEMFEKPVNRPSKAKTFEWEIAYVFPLVVIVIVQLLMILGIISTIGYLPYNFFAAYSFIQSLTNYNLYRILGFALIIMAAYPYILNPKAVNKTHGKYVFLVGLVFLARGFTDASFILAEILSIIFAFLDLPIAIIALFILIWVILSIFKNKNNDEFDDVEVDEVYSSRSKPKRVKMPVNENKGSNKSKSFNSSSGKIKFDSRKPFNERRR